MKSTSRKIFLINNDYILISIIITGFFLLCSFQAGSITGLHFDEAWSILKAKEISNGVHTFEGMSGHAGVSYQYLLTPFFEKFGYTIEVMRIVSSILSAMTLLSIILIVRLIHPGKKYHLLTGLLLATSPFFVTHSRLAIEVTVLNPLLIFSGLLFLTAAITLNSSPTRTLSTLGGICFGLAVYSHLLSLAFILSLIVTAVILYRKEVTESKIGWFTLVGFIIGFLPYVVGKILSYFNPNLLVSNSVNSFSFYEFLRFFRAIKDIDYLPVLLIDLLDGNSLYQRFIGKTNLPVIPYVSVGLMILLAMIVLAKIKVRISRFDRAVLVCFTICLILTFFITPFIALKYFILSAFIIPYLIVRLVATLLEKTHKRSIHKLAISTIAIFFILNCLYLVLNYYIPFSQTGGNISVFKVGRRLTETSNSNVRIDGLYEQLLSQNVEVAISQAFINIPLKAYDIDHNAMQFIDIAVPEPTALFPTDRAITQQPGKKALIYYNGPMASLATKAVTDLRGHQAITLDSLTFKLDQSFDPNFLVYISDH